MFQCHKCGYKDFSEKEKTHCPICNANITTPKYALILFFSLIGLIVFGFLSVFNDTFYIISNILIAVAVIFTPLAINEAINRKNKVKDGFRIPDYPSEIINENLRVPNFESYWYIFGLKNDKGIKNLMLETHDKGLNLFHSNMQEILTINYSDIAGLVLHSKVNTKQYDTKSLLLTAAFSAIGGLSAGMLASIIAGTETEDIYFLEIQVKEKDSVNSIYISESKEKLLLLADNLERKVNGG